MVVEQAQELGLLVVARRRRRSRARTGCRASRARGSRGRRPSCRRWRASGRRRPSTRAPPLRGPRKPSRGPERWVWPKITCAASMRRLRTTSAIARTPARPISAAERSERSGPMPSRLARPTAPGTATRPGEPAAERRRPAVAPVDRLPDARRRVRPRHAPRAGAALGEPVEERVQGRLHRLVVVGGAMALGRAAEHPLDHADTDALEGRHCQVCVQVVPMRRVYVVPHPYPRVGQDHLCLTRSARKRTQRARVGLRDLLELQRRRAAHPPPLEPGSEQLVVVVSGHDHDPPVADRLAERLEERRRDLEHLGQRAVAQLEHVAEQDDLVRALGRAGEQLARTRAGARGRRRCARRGGGRRRMSVLHVAASNVTAARRNTRFAMAVVAAQIEVENPATGEVVATVPDLGPEEVAAAVATARAAQPAWNELGFEGRAEVLLAARSWLGRELRARRRDDRLGDRQELGRRRAVGADLRHRGARLLGREGARVPRRRGGRDGEPVRSRAQASDALRAGRRRGRDRALELPADELVRRLHPGARGRQRGRDEAVGDHAADLAADGRDARRVGAAPGRLPGRDRPR